MSETTAKRTIGIEEELLLVDPDSGAPRAVAGRMLRRSSGDAAERAPEHGEIEAELQQQQIEVETSPSEDLEELERQVVAWRRYADELARPSGARLAALATSPLPVDPRATIKPRYQRMVERFALTTMEQLTCGCHVHVGVNSPEEGVAVINRIQPWLPVLTALSANSPFWQGRDSGYASFRTQAWSRFPTAGPTPPFGNPHGYQRFVDDLIATGVPLDADMMYFNARLSQHYPTVEIRVADVCARTADTIMIAGLARALVDTAATEAATGRPALDSSTDQLRMAQWRASRDGVRGDLLDPRTMIPRPASEVLGVLLEYVGPALDAAGDTERVRAGIDRVLAEGTGADLQRAALVDSAELVDVVRAVIELTNT